MKLSLERASTRIYELLDSTQDFITYFVQFNALNLLTYGSEDSEKEQGVNLLTDTNATVSLDGDYTVAELKLLVAAMEAVQSIDVEKDEE